MGSLQKSYVVDIAFPASFYLLVGYVMALSVSAWVLVLYIPILFILVSQRDRLIGKGGK